MRQRAAQLPQASNRQVGDLPCIAPDECARSGFVRLPENGDGTTGDCLADVAAAVGQRTGVGQKQIARRDLAAVVGHPAGQHAQPRQACQRCVGGSLGAAQADRRTHSLAFAVGIPRLCATSSGASGAMPSVRSVPLITAAKTGAATSPP